MAALTSEMPNPQLIDDELIKIIGYIVSLRVAGQCDQNFL
jgi:hypothetical protein